MFTTDLIFEVTKLAVGIIAFAAALRTLDSNAQGKLYDQYIKFQELLLAQHELRTYFYDRSELEGDASAVKKGKLEGMCEVLGAMLEHASMQRSNLRNDSWDNCWRMYTRERMEQSPYFHQFLMNNKNLYTRGFVKIVEELDLEIRAKHSD